MNLRLAIAAVAHVGLMSCATGTELEQLRKDPGTATTRDSARTIFAGRPFATHDIHGTQVEFHRDDGTSFLWSPGNRRAVPARWKVQSYAGSSYEICWKYPSSSRNGVTGVAGGRWECKPFFSYASGLSEVVTGDPFDLSSGAVPFTLQRGRLTTRQLLQMDGKSASAAQIIYSN